MSTYYTVTGEDYPGEFSVCREFVYQDGENVTVDFRFGMSISAPGVRVGVRSENYEDLFQMVEVS